MGVTLAGSGDAPGAVRACDSIVLKQLNTAIAAERALKPAADAYFGLELRLLRGTCYAVSYSMGWFRLSVFSAYDTSF